MPTKNILRVLFRIIIQTICIITPVVMMGCNDSIGPFDKLIDGIAVNCMLDNRNENTIVRVQKVHIDNSPVDMSKYKVILSESFGAQYILEDTLINNSPNTKYFKFRTNLLQRGKNYMIALVKDGNAINWSNCKFPDVTNWSYIDTIIEPPGEPIKWNVELKLPKILPDVFLYRFVIRYQYHINQKIVDAFAEVPLKLSIETTQQEYNTNWMIYEYNYDILNKTFIHLHLRDDPVTFQFRNKASYFSAEYDGYNTLACLKSLSKNISSEITIMGASALFYNIDSTYYQYYMKEGNTPWSIRLDQELYESNIESKNGLNLGFFGAICVDTLSIKVPEFLINDCKYLNGQK